MVRYFDDVQVGDVYEFGTYDVTESEVRSFAEQYDPQWFHTDPARAADESMYGGLIASGWHTTAMTMRLLVDNYFRDAAALGAKGVDELRWWQPVRPGDELSVRLEVRDKRVETAARGLVELAIETRRGDDGETVCSMVALVLFARAD